MFNLCKAEFYKLKRTKIFYFFILLIIMQAIVVCAFSEKLKLMSGKETIVYMLFIQSTLALNIITGVFAADYIVTEFTSGYIKNLISFGHKRINIFISKATVYYIGIIIIEFIVPLGMTVINIIINGYGEAFTFDSLLFLIKLILTMIIIQIAVGSIFVLAAFVFRSVNITIVIVIALDLINRILNIMVIDKPSLEWIFNKLILSQPNIILYGKAGNGEFLQACIVSLITIFITTIVGIYMFKKIDIK